MKHFLGIVSFVATLSSLAVSSAPTESCASIFTVTAQLTGDPRPGNPDNLIVDVTIEVNGGVASWIVDLNSPLHPNIKLHNFFFNLDTGGATLAFSNFAPDKPDTNMDWGVVDAINAEGSGSADFQYAIGGGKNENEVNAGTPLTFVTTLSSGDFTLSMFDNAPTSSSKDSLLGSGFQLGAHLQSLVAGQGESNSGFAVGVFDTPPSDVTIGAPEATSIVAWLGLAALGIVRARKWQQCGLSTSAS